MSEERGTVVHLALINSYDPASGVVAEFEPVADADIPEIIANGYDIIDRVTGHDPFTHVITTGVHDYLAAIE